MGEIYRNFKDHIFSLPFIQINFPFFLLNSFIFRIKIRIIFNHKPLKNNILSVCKRLISFNLHSLKKT